MAECSEAVFAMIIAHTAVTNSAKGQIVIGDVEDGIIYAAAAEGDAVYQLFCQLFIFGENICGEGMRSVVYTFHRVIQVFIRDDGQYGTEDLLLHDFVIPGSVLYYGGRNPALDPV